MSQHKPWEECLRLAVASENPIVVETPLLVQNAAYLGSVVAGMISLITI